ncbi:septum formation family protein [Neomicrococcus aestuarii]|uniref:Septum formation-related domain-containing protein n=1 Tax=Neomicrococcus aestuarii TaxID=556325 RepID=A0A1L2ZQE5_9MICC|nr:septum formation family protein [Neomicrococcus aestuarii]APF41366.1 hypothetical protein BHE16_10595 [Neomicrococcus aestuarii]
MNNESPEPQQTPASGKPELSNEIFDIANQPHEVEPETSDTPPSSGWTGKRIIALVAALVVVALIAIGIFNVWNNSANTTAEEPTVSRSATPGIDGIIAKNVPVNQVRLGDCVRGFTGPLDKATVVTCTTDHNAQLIGLPKLENQPEEYPGSENVSASGLDACKAITLNVASLGTADWRYEYSSPSKDSWADGDREIVCFLKSEGSTTKTSLLPLNSSAAASGTGAASSSSAKKTGTSSSKASSSKASSSAKD